MQRVSEQCKYNVCYEFRKMPEMQSAMEKRVNRGAKHGGQHNLALIPI